MIGQSIGLGVTFDAVERAERTEFFTDVGVVDISIDNVANYILRMQALPDSIGTRSEIQQVAIFKESECLAGSYAHALRSRFQNAFNASHRNCTLRTDLIAPTLAAFS